MTQVDSRASCLGSEMGLGACVDGGLVGLVAWRWCVDAWVGGLVGGGVISVMRGVFVSYLDEY